MFSTLAKYIFGGILGDAPETTPTQYETREVNDWLLVDMPDQAIDNEDLDSESDVEENELLSSVQLLMRCEENDNCDNSYHEIQIPKEEISTLDTQIATQSTLLNECPEGFQFLPESLYLNETLYYPSDFSLAISCYFKEYHPTATAVHRACSFKAEICREVTDNEDNTSTVVRIMRKPLKIDNLINHPAAYSNNFINHRSQALPPKTASLEQIKELKPAQRAMEYNAKKYLTRSQLNRQNRNYIYESSVKTNRRRNLQRKHSGANNNRKC